MGTQIPDIQDRMDHTREIMRWIAEAWDVPTENVQITVRSEPNVTLVFGDPHLECRRESEGADES